MITRPAYCHQWNLLGSRNARHVLPRAFGVRDKVGAILGTENAMNQVGRQRMHHTEAISWGWLRR